MIKAVKNIPIEAEISKKHRKTIIQLVREDFLSAFKQGIEKFEFYGDGYNLKYLQNYCNSPIIDVVRIAMHTRYSNYIEKKDVKIVPISFDELCKKVEDFYHTESMYNKAIVMRTCLDKDSQPHVYGEINFDMLDEIWKQYFEKFLRNETVSVYKNMQFRKKMAEPISKKKEVAA